MGEYPFQNAMSLEKPSSLDEYDRNARLKPAFIAALPAGLLLAGLGARYSAAVGIVVGPLTAAGLAYFVVQIGRDFGKRKEQRLISLWGGKPSTARLRHRDGKLSSLTLGRYHKVAATLIGQQLPTKSEEEADPVAADSIYESVGDYLREKTRDKKSFPLVFKELVGYGFRRNLWGLKPIALTVSIACSAIQLISLGLHLVMHESPAEASLILTGTNLALLACWIFVINPAWVKLSADAYADRLLAACEVVTAGKPARGRS
jgi:hypothetical protein